MYSILYTEAVVFKWSRNTVELSWMRIQTLPVSNVKERSYFKNTSIDKKKTWYTIWDVIFETEQGSNCLDTPIIVWVGLVIAVIPLACGCYSWHAEICLATSGKGVLFIVVSPSFYALSALERTVLADTLGMRCRLDLPGECRSTCATCPCASDVTHAADNVCPRSRESFTACSPALFLCLDNDAWKRFSSVLVRRNASRAHPHATAGMMLGFLSLLARHNNRFKTFSAEHVRFCTMRGLREPVSPFCCQEMFFQDSGPICKLNCS